MTSETTLVVGLGEALYDCFPDREVLGGAPINVVVHASAFLPGGAVPATRVGDDDLGRRFLSQMAERGISSDHVQIDPIRPTGRVRVAVDPDGEPSYTFDDHSAWDAIEFDHSMQELAARCSAVTFGTLAQRESQSRDSMRSFLGSAPQSLRLLDVNLRQGFYSAEVLDASLELASAVKLNRDEVRVIADLLNLEDEAELVDRYNLNWLALTRGHEGTLLLRDGQWREGEAAAVEPEPNVDQVGAGDACCAGLIYGMLQEWSESKTLTLANAMGAWVASRQGATPPLPPEILRLAAD